MGNHEFCTECGESDFHMNRPCNPEKLKAYQDQEKQLKLDQAAARKRTLELAAAIEKQFGVKFETDGYGSEEFNYIRLHFWKGLKAKL